MLQCVIKFYSSLEKNWNESMLITIKQIMN